MSVNLRASLPDDAAWPIWPSCRRQRRARRVGGAVVSDPSDDGQRSRPTARQPRRVVRPHQPQDEHWANWLRSCRALIGRNDVRGLDRFLEESPSREGWPSSTSRPARDASGELIAACTTTPPPATRRLNQCLASGRRDDGLRRDRGGCRTGRLRVRRSHWQAGRSGVACSSGDRSRQRRTCTAASSTRASSTTLHAAVVGGGADPAVGHPPLDDGR